MANISAFASKAMLDWTTGPRPRRRFVSLCGTGNRHAGLSANAASEMGSNTMGAVRQTVLFGAAASPAGSASNTAAMTFGPFCRLARCSARILWDGSPVNSSNMMWQGTLAAARTFASGDSLVFAAGV